MRLATDMRPGEDFDAIRIELRGFAPDGTPIVVTDRTLLELGVPPAGGGFHEVATFGVVPAGGDPSRRFEVEAVALRQGRTLFATRARTGFVRRRTIALDVYLPASCLSTALDCLPDETCGVSGCTSPEVDPEALPGVDSPMAVVDPRDPSGRGRGEACTLDDECDREFPACARLVPYDDTRGCLRPCASDADCGDFARCEVEDDGGRFCSIPCRPGRPVRSCPTGTFCKSRDATSAPEPAGFTHCAPWAAGSLPRYSLCQEGRELCAAPLVCVTTDGRATWHCTDACEVGDDACPDGFFCNALRVDGERRYGFCKPEGEPPVWPAPP